jgi:hypothetical protein
MPQFKIKDLMVQVLPDAKLAGQQYCLLPSVPCVPPSINCRLLYSYVPTGCWPITCPGNTCLITDDRCGLLSPYIAIDVRDLVVNPAELAYLKDQLRRSLARVEEVEARVDEDFSPQSLEQIETLETQFQDALEALDARKKELKKRGG